MAPERLRLPPEPGSAAGARSFLAGRLRAAGITGSTADVGLLLVSELATNALRHAGTELEVTVTATDSGVRVAVGDADPARPPGPRTAVRPDAEGGRGLAIVDRLADRWGVDTGPAGKAVWFELDRRAAGRAPA